MQNKKLNIKDWLKNNVLIFFLLLLCVIVAIAQPRFLTAGNLINVATQVAINAFLATGVTFVIISGGIDIGIGSVAALSGIVAAVVVKDMPNASVFVCIIISLGIAVLVGLACGLFNGIMVVKFKVVPMIATLAMMSVARGLAYVVTNGKPVFGLPENFSYLGTARFIKTDSMPVGWIPVIVILTVLVMTIAHIFLSKTVTGRRIYAVGSNSDVSFLSGIKVGRVTILAYAICGVCAAIGGVCIASKLNTGQPTSATGYEMYAIAAVALGGTSLSGGSGGITRTITGILTIGVLNNGMNLLGIPSFWQTIVMGLVILLAVVIDQMQEKTK